MIVSTDFIKAERHRDDFIRVCPDLVIVDEAHGFALGNDRGRQLRNELLTRLASDPDRHIILVTATPHSGNEDAFRSLLALLDPTLMDLPDDMSGEHNRRHRARLARHLVQRRRGDIETYLDVDTPFPNREQADFTYQLTPEYRRLFEKAVNFARESYQRAEGDVRRQRVHWWSALALLRSLGSSPAAAVATLHARANNAEARTVAEADELGRRAVLDQAGDADAESLDVTPGARYQDTEQDGSERAQVRGDTWFRELANDAAALSGPNDPKLQAVIKLVDELLAAGYNPILFCRFIPTAEYVAEHLREHLSKRRKDPVEVAAVTGTLAPAEREDRVAELAALRPPGARRDRLPVRGHQPAGRLRCRRPLRPLLEPDPPRAAGRSRRPLRPTRANRSHRHLLRGELADRRDRARGAAQKAPANPQSVGSRRPGADRLRGRDRRDPRRADHPRPIRARARSSSSPSRSTTTPREADSATRPRMAGRRRTRTQDPHPVRPAHDPARRGPPRADR